MKYLKKTNFLNIFNYSTKQSNQSKRLIVWLFGALLIFSTFSRIDAQVTVDSTFNADADKDVRAIVEQPDGKILIGGSFTVINGQPRNGVARLNEDGTLDNAFNPNVKGSVYAIALQPDGKILVGGIFTADSLEQRENLARLNTDGTLDTAFADSSTDNTIIDIVIQPDGKILIGGYFTIVGRQTHIGIARLYANGSLDSAFDPNVNRGTGEIPRSVEAIALQPDGRILIGGNFFMVGGQTQNGIARLNIDGTLDSAFASVPIYGASDILLQSNGKILVRSPYLVNGVKNLYPVRLNENGTIDNTFNQNINGVIFAMNIQSDGKILIGGYFTTVGGQARNSFARLNEDGTPDISFSPNFDNNVNKIALQRNGQILVGGDFTRVDGQAHNHIARLNETASTIDTPIVFINNVSAFEGNSGTTAFNFTVNRIGGSERTTKIDYSTSDISAIAPFDYQSASGTITFAPGETAKTIVILVNGDTEAEESENFRVDISADVSGGAVTITEGGGVGTIRGDDACSYSLSSSGASISAAAATGSFNVIAGVMCGYTAVSNASFITITSGSAKGNGTITYSIAANTGGAARTGSIFIFGQRFTINQAANKSRRRIRFF
jgi:uncharacterized delta-60 repeat protein